MQSKQPLYLLLALGLAFTLGTSQADTLVLKPTSFNELPGWQQTKLTQSLKAFKSSCQLLLKEPDSTPVGTPQLPLTVHNWRAVCQAAMKLHKPSKQQIKNFFTTQFKAYAVFNGDNDQGLFTAYYLPSFPGRLQRSKHYSVPIYAHPDDLVTARLGLFSVELQGKKIAGKVVDGHLYPYGITREQINNGALGRHAKVIAWVKHRADRYVLQVQGSGYIKLADGKRLLLGYNGDNGEKYYPIARWLIAHQQISREQMSTPKIYQWLLSHPKQASVLLNKNQAFVFFTVLPYQAPLGTQGVPLTNGYSLAVDGRIIPLGAPLWVNTALPQAKDPKQLTPLKRLFIAQDTGGAIRGIVRADIYLGDLPHAGIIAGHTKSEGRYWLLLPKNFTPVV